MVGVRIGKIAVVGREVVTAATAAIGYERSKHDDWSRQLMSTIMDALAGLMVRLHESLKLCICHGHILIMVAILG